MIFVGAGADMVRLEYDDGWKYVEQLDREQDEGGALLGQLQRAWSLWGGDAERVLRWYDPYSQDTGDSHPDIVDLAGAAVIGGAQVEGTGWEPEPHLEGRTDIDY